MSEALSQLGFQCELKSNLVQSDTAAAVDAFVASLEAGDLAFFYFSGHGSMVGGSTYMLPIDFDSDERKEAYSLGLLNENLNRCKGVVSIVALDCCRSQAKPQTMEEGGSVVRSSDSESSASESLPAPHTVPRSAVRLRAGEVFVAFPTGPGSSAIEDRAKGNGRFTHHLLHHLLRPDVDIETACMDASFDMDKEAAADCHSDGQQAQRISTLRQKVVLRHE